MVLDFAAFVVKLKVRTYTKVFFISEGCLIEIKDLYWAAGFLEGEGNFGQPCHVSVSACQVQKQPLERIQDLFGGRLSFRKRENPNHNDIWEWKIHGAYARGIMMTLFDLLSPKRQDQIRATLHSGDAYECRSGHHRRTVENTRIMEPSKSRGKHKRCLICYKAQRRRKYERRLERQHGLTT